MEHFPLRQRVTLTTKIYCSATLYFTFKVKQFVTDLAISIGSDMINILVHTY
ncbi:unnamed protein product [Tenebrio molitor]|nr:unnamed protein product [Tenebrio molitor]